MDSDQNLVGNEKTARACDSCIKKRARWYCTADDAFLCQTCDATVHSANPLALRHQRVRLKTASLMTHLSLQVPSWHHGFTKKPRTPRPQHHRHRQRYYCKLTKNPLHLVPEIEDNNDEQAEQLIYRVPIFDLEMSLSGTSNESGTRIGDDVKKNNKVEFYEQNMDVEEFAADVNNLLCKGFDDEKSFDMETLGFLDTVESCSWSHETVVKFEEEEEEMKVNYEMLEDEIDITKESFELNLDNYDSLENYEEEDEKVGVGGSVIELKEECEVTETLVKEKKSKIILALNYEEILAAWPEQKSAWTTGDRPELEDSDCWPDCMGGHDDQSYYPVRYVEMSGMAKMDSGREARVSRYREKRRSRLFSKKIRYEVRKLNAEKRPRMKGRFVKRANFVAASN